MHVVDKDICFEDEHAGRDQDAVGTYHGHSSLRPVSIWRESECLVDPPKTVGSLSEQALVSISAWLIKRMPTRL